MAQLEAKGYGKKVDTIGSNGRADTQRQHVMKHQWNRKPTDQVKKFGQGIYLLGVADGAHTMTLTWDGRSFKLMDQHKRINYSGNKLNDVNKKLQKWTKNLESVDNGAGATQSALLHIFKLDIKECP